MARILQEIFFFDFLLHNVLLMQNTYIFSGGKAGYEACCDERDCR